MSEYRFVVDKSDLEGKQGVLKKDAEGYYNDVLVSVWNVANSIGERYIIDNDVMNMLDPDKQLSQMTKWLKAGKLIGEKEHPHISEFISKDTTYEFAKSLWIQRNAELRVDNKAMQYAGLRTAVLPDKVDGRTVHGVFARIRPTVEELDLSLGDPNSNTAFSLRSYIRRMLQGTEIIRKCTNLFTHDWVNSNGLPKCEKFSMPGLESGAMGCILTPRIITDINEIYERDLEMGCESGAGIITQVIKESGQWREVPSITPTILLGRQLDGIKRFI